MRGTSHYTLSCALVLALAPTLSVSAQSREDVATLDGIIRAYYEVVSGPAGEPADRERDMFLHHPDALVGMAGLDAEGRPTIQTMTLGEYHDRFGGPRSAAFYEWEINREVLRFGSIAHVWSTYMESDAPDGEPSGRGINSIALYFDGERWWITGWIYDSEREGNAIPPEYLPR